MKKHSFTFYLLSVVCVLALMAASMTVGALAFPRETIVEVPKEVLVPVEPETIVMEEIGLTLILPDSWKGRYSVAKDEQNDGHEYIIYSTFVRDAFSQGIDAYDGGVLFYIMRWEDAMTQSQFEESGLNFTRCRYLFVTADATYVLYYASDVQYDPQDPEQEEEYLSMFQQISEIQIVVNDAFAQTQTSSSGL